MSFLISFFQLTTKYICQYKIANFHVVYCLTVSPDQLIKIITHPKSQTVRLTRVEETVTLECRAESHSGHQLEYKWYYLSGIVNPKTMKKENKDPKSTDPHCIITVKPSKKQVSRYYCEVSIPNQPECCVPSEVAVIKPECGKSP